MQLFKEYSFAKACRLLLLSLITVMLTLAAVYFSFKMMQDYLSKPVYIVKYEMRAAPSEPYEYPDYVICHAWNRKMNWSRVPINLLRDSTTCPEFLYVKSVNAINMSGMACELQKKLGVQILQWSSSNDLGVCSRYAIPLQLFTGEIDFSKYLKSYFLYTSMVQLIEDGGVSSDFKIFFLKKDDAFFWLHSAAKQQFKLNVKQLTELYLDPPVHKRLLPLKIGGSCVNEASKPFLAFIPEDIPYTGNNCVTECWINRTLEVAQCLPDDPRLEPQIRKIAWKLGYPVCVKKRRFYPPFHNCTKRCQSMCSFWEYGITKKKTSVVKSASTKVLASIKADIEESNFYDISVAVPNSSYGNKYSYLSYGISRTRSSLFYVHDERVAMGLPDFVGSIGGVFGIYLGISFFGFIQFLLKAVSLSKKLIFSTPNKQEDNEIAPEVVMENTDIEKKIKGAIFNQ